VFPTVSNKFCVNIKSEAIHISCATNNIDESINQQSVFALHIRRDLKL